MFFYASLSRRQNNLYYVFINVILLHLQVEEAPVLPLEIQVS